MLLSVNVDVLRILKLLLQLPDAVAVIEPVTVLEHDSDVDEVMLKLCVIDERVLVRVTVTPPLGLADLEGLKDSEIDLLMECVTDTDRSERLWVKDDAVLV